MTKNIQRTKLAKIAIALTTSISLISPNLTNAEELDPIRIGANLELSGYGSAYGIPILDNLQLAADEVNAKGGLLGGRQIEIIDFDNTSNKTEATSIATRLTDENVAAIIGPATSDMIFASRPAAIESAIPTMYPVGTANNLTYTDEGDVITNIFRLAFTYSFQGKAAARFGIDNLGATKAVVITDESNDYSVGLATPFKEEFEELGGTIVEQFGYNTGDQDFSSIMTSLSAIDFDILYIPGFFSEGGILIRQARELGINQPILSGHGFASDTLIEIAGAQNATDLYITSHFYTGSDRPQAIEYIKTFEERFGSKPDTFDALSYDASHLLLQAIEEAGSSDPTAITEALESIQFEGVTGAFKYDELHNAVESAPMLHYINGEVTEVFEVSGN